MRIDLPRVLSYIGRACTPVLNILLSMSTCHHLRSTQCSPCTSMRYNWNRRLDRFKQRTARATALKREEDMRHKLERTALLEEAEALQRQLSAMKLELSAKLAAWQNNEADELDKNYPDIAALFEDVYKLKSSRCLVDALCANHEGVQKLPPIRDWLAVVQPAANDGLQHLGHGGRRCIREQEVPRVVF